ncbi:hypothetical protein BH24ACT1_BH24ACT1_06190 [soil metagenome]
MAALVHDRLRPDQAGAEPSDGHDGRRLRAIGPGGVGVRVGGRRCREEPRRPLLAVVAVLGLMLAGGPVVDAVASLGGRSVLSQAAPAGDRPVVGGRVHLVQPGETYWSVAKALGGGGDIRARVDALKAANGGASLQAGDRLAVPILD